jgi:hypothetical protein
MFSLNKERERTLEIALLIVVVGLTGLLHQVGVQKMVVLNLFYLPVGLAALFLGRYRAGVLALFCAIAAASVSMLNLESFSSPASPLATALALTVWAAVMGLNALLVGTLSDERAANLRDLHDAHVGVVEVLSRYLTSADARIKGRTQRVAELSQRIAVEMKLSPQEVDDVRVAALLQDIGNFEVTAKVIRRAVDDLSRDPQRDTGEHTFHGSDFAQSLGGVLTGALALMCHQRDPLRLPADIKSTTGGTELLHGAKILEAVRAYDRLMHEGGGAIQYDATEALRELKCDVDAHHNPNVLLAMERILLHGSASAKLEAALKERNRVAARESQQQPAKM